MVEYVDLDLLLCLPLEGTNVFMPYDFENRALPHNVFERFEQSQWFGIYTDVVALLARSLSLMRY